MRNFWILMVCIVWSCGPDPIPEPEPSLLISPTNGDLCTTASKVNDAERQVRFQWTAALNTEIYELIVQNTQTGQQYSKQSSLLSESLILPMGAPYRWYVLSKATLTPAVGQSESWKFYLEGEPNASYVPFPALLLSPENEAIIDKTDEGVYTFQWEGLDLDNDIDHYALYLGTDPDALSLKKDSISEQRTDLTLTPSATYYWQIVTFDKEGNQSASLVFSFQIN